MNTEPFFGFPRLFSALFSKAFNLARPCRLLKPLAALLLGMLPIFGAVAQLASDDPDWKELDVQTPPAFSRENLIPLDMPSYVSLKFGVDPATLTVSADGVVRYVMLATSASGTVNAMYEGLRCGTGEFKTYARAGTSGVWGLIKEPQWRALNDSNISRHALALARQGACEGRTPGASTARGIIQRLKS